MQAFKRVLFGLSAYTPLFFMFMVSAMFEPDDTFRRATVGASAFVIVIGAVFFMLNIAELNKMQNTTDMKITGCTYGSKVSFIFDRPEYFLPYISAPVLLLYRLVCATEEVDVRVTIAVLVFVAFNILLAMALILSLELYAMNPMLYLCGYRFYDTDVMYLGIDPSKKNTMSITLISKDGIERFECIQMKNVVDKVYVSFGGTGKDEL